MAKTQHRKVADSEIALIGKIAVIDGLAPWVFDRLRPVVDLVEMKKELESELKALTTQK